MSTKTWLCGLCGREITQPHFKRHLWKHDREGRGEQTSAEWLAFVNDSGYFDSKAANSQQRTEAST